MVYLVLCSWNKAHSLLGCSLVIAKYQQVHLLEELEQRHYKSSEESRAVRNQEELDWWALPTLKYRALEQLSRHGRMDFCVNFYLSK